jgi:hypothetical protein
MARDVSREERVARNELAFRQANESLRTIFEDATEEAEGSYPFLCECGDRRCTDVVPVSLQVYARIREHPARFLILPGHKQLESERVVEEGDKYEIVEKSGVAGDLARTDWVRLSPNQTI